MKEGNNVLIKVEINLLTALTACYLLGQAAYAQNGQAFKPTMTPIRNDFGSTPKFPPPDPNKQISFPRTIPGPPPVQNSNANANPGQTPNQTQGQTPRR